MYSSSQPESNADRARESARRTLREARDAVNDTKDDINKAAHDAGQRVRAAVTTASRGISDATGAVASQIRDNPVRSSVIALGLGLFLGAFLRRR